MNSEDRKNQKEQSVDFQKIGQGDKKYWYGLSPAQQEECKKFIAREGFKPLIKGLASILDVPSMGVNAVNWGINKGTNFISKGLKGSIPELPYAPYTTDYIGKLVDKGTFGYSRGEPKDVVGRGIEFGAGMLGGGMAAKGLNAGSKISPWLGSTKPTDIIAGATTGGVTQYAEDSGYSPLGAAATGLAGGIGVGAFGNVVKQGFFCKQAKTFDKGTYDIAQKYGLDLPNNTFDKSWGQDKATALGERSYITGNKIKESREVANQSFYNAFNKALDKTGSKEGKRSFASSEKALKKYRRLAEASIPNELSMKKSETLKGLAYSTEFVDAIPLISNFEKTNIKSMINQIKKEVRIIKAESGDSLYMKEILPLRDLIRSYRRNISKANINHHKALWPIQKGMEKDLLAYRGLQGKESPMHKYFMKETELLGQELRNKQKEILNFKSLSNPAQDFDPHQLAKNYKNTKNQIIDATVEYPTKVGWNEGIKDLDNLAKVVDVMPKSLSHTPIHKNMQLLLLSGGGAALTGATEKYGWGRTALGSGILYILAEFAPQLFTNKDSSYFKALVSYAKKQSPGNKKKVLNLSQKELGMSIEEFNKELDSLYRQGGIASREYVNKKTKEIDN